MATTRKVLRQAIIEKLYSPRRPTASSTTSGGNTTTLLDSLLSPSAQSEDFIRAWIYIIELQGFGPAVGSVARITGIDFSGSTSTITVAPAFASATESGMDYEIHYIFHPEDVNVAIDDINRSGTRGALGALANDSATTVLERDILVDGVLAALKRRWARDTNDKLLKMGAQAHEDAFQMGLIRLGYQLATPRSG